ncbi:hypothetical protein BDR03DRAFT_945933, partial [Suillus americanus]
MLFMGLQVHNEFRVMLCLFFFIVQIAPYFLHISYSVAFTPLLFSPLNVTVAQMTFFSKYTNRVVLGIRKY